MGAPEALAFRGQLRKLKDKFVSLAKISAYNRS
jgi:hypothetical protein